MLFSVEIEQKFKAMAHILAKIDNIFDIHYRTYSSGISAPGRNIRLGLNLKF